MNISTISDLNTVQAQPTIPTAPPIAYPNLSNVNKPNYEVPQMQQYPQANLWNTHQQGQTTQTYPPQAEGNTQRPETAHIVVVNNAPQPLGRDSQRIICRQCNSSVQTDLAYRTTFRTHIMAMLFCFTGLWCLVPLPYLIRSCKQLDHFCPNCNQFIGKTMP